MANILNNGKKDEVWFAAQASILNINSYSAVMELLEEIPLTGTDSGRGKNNSCVHCFFPETKAFSFHVQFQS